MVDELTAEEFDHRLHEIRLDLLALKASIQKNFLPSEQILDAEFDDIVDKINDLRDKLPDGSV